MTLLRNLVSVGVVSVIATSIGIESQPALAGCNPFGCSQSSVAECNPFGCPNAPVGQACTPFGCPASPQPPQPTQAQPQPIYVQPQTQPVYVQPQTQPVYVQPQTQPVYVQPQTQPIYVQPQTQPVYVQPQTQPQPGTQVPINQGYNLVGGVWFGPNGNPVPADRRPGEDPAACIARVSFFNLQAYSQSQTHGDYRYNRPSSLTPQQMIAAGLENQGGLFSEKWRGSQPQVTLRVMDSQEATIRCR